MTIYVTGCTHFGHENIIRLADRPFDTVEHMDETLIENWNNTVKWNDVVYHLGDFAFRSVKDPDAYLNRLNGQIVLLQGNHDPKGWGDHYREIRHRKTKFCLMHYPIEEWNGWFKGSIHLHCHTHKRELVSAERRFNVGVDATDFWPISLDEIMEMI